MVTRMQSFHRHTVRCLQTVGKQPKRMLHVDAALLRLMVSTLVDPPTLSQVWGPGDSFIMLYSCPSCNTAPLRMRD
eukprot:4047032-Amphidinium_carterae.2